MNISPDFTSKLSLMTDVSFDFSSYKNLPSNVNVVLLGKTGSGKSETGNTILGEKRFDSKGGLISCTRTVQLGHKQDSDNVNLHLMDTPGLFDTRPNITNEDIFLEIIKSALDFPDGIHVFIIVCRCDVRFTKEENDTIIEIEKWFKGIYKHCLLIMTHAGEFWNDSSLERTIRGDKYIASLVENVSRQVIAIENNIGQNHPGWTKEFQSKFVRASIYEVVSRLNGDIFTNELFKKAKLCINEEKQRLKSLSELQTFLAKCMYMEILNLPAKQIKRLQNEKCFPNQVQEKIRGMVQKENLNYISKEDINSCITQYIEENEHIIQEQLSQKEEDERMLAIAREAQRKKKKDEEEHTLEQKLATSVQQFLWQELLTLDTSEVEKTKRSKKISPSIRGRILEDDTIRALDKLVHKDIDTFASEFLIQHESHINTLIAMRRKFEEKEDLKIKVTSIIEENVATFLRETPFPQLKIINKSLNQDKVPKSLVEEVKQYLGPPENLVYSESVLENTILQILKEKKATLEKVLKEERKDVKGCYGFISVKKRRCTIL